MSSEAPWAPYEDAFRYRVDEGQNLAGPTITDEITRAVEVRARTGVKSQSSVENGPTTSASLSRMTFSARTVSRTSH